MLRHPMMHSAALRRCTTSTLRVSHRGMADKMIVGAAASFITSASILGVFHLVVTPVSLGVAAATIGAATTTGALCVVDGGKDSSGSTFGVVAGCLIGAMGGYYEKTSAEPWR